MSLHMRRKERSMYKNERREKKDVKWDSRTKIGPTVSRRHIYRAGDKGISLPFRDEHTSILFSSTTRSVIICYHSLMKRLSRKTQYDHLNKTVGFLLYQTIATSKHTDTRACPHDTSQDLWSMAKKIVISLRLSWASLTSIAQTAHSHFSVSKAECQRNPNLKGPWDWQWGSLR